VFPIYALPSHVWPTTNDTASSNLPQLRDEFISDPFDRRNGFSLKETRPSTSASDYENIIKEVVAHVANIQPDDIDHTQTIFHLGLDSISAIRLSSELRSKGILLSVSKILTEATVERMALSWSTRKEETNKKKPTIDDTSDVLRELLTSISLNDCPDMAHIPSGCEMIPMTPGQLFLASAWCSSLGVNFLPTFCFESSSPLDVKQLESAWGALMASNPVLRSRFISTTSSTHPMVQMVYPSLEHSFEIVSSQPIAEDFRVVKEKTYLKQQKKDFADDVPLVRLCALQSEKNTICFLTVHHALYDAISLPLLFQQLEALYYSREIKTTHNLLPDYLAYIYSTDKIQQKEFWTQYLQDATISCLTKISPRDNQARIEVYKPRAIKEGSNLEKKCFAHGLTLQSILLASFSKILSEHLSQDQVVFGIYVANRHSTDDGLELAQATIPTLNFLPLRVKETFNRSILQLAENIQKDLIEFSVNNRNLSSLWDIYQWTGIQVDCFVNFLKEPKRELEEGHSKSEDLFHMVKAEELYDGVLPQRDFKHSSLESNMTVGVLKVCS